MTMTNLQERAQAFLDRPIPAELAKRYVSGSLSELFIRRYAAEGTLAVNEETAELIELCAMESEAGAEGRNTPEAKAYFEECASILAAILAERSHAR